MRWWREKRGREAEPDLAPDHHATHRTAHQGRSCGGPGAVTAIFAFATTDALFVCGDTQRGSPFRLTVQKVHAWGDQVLFGQAGNGRQQSGLISELKLRRCLPTHDGEAALRTLYVGLHPSYRVAVTAPSRPNGTIMIAALDDGTGVPGLVAYDFDTGLRTALPGPVTATGADDTKLTVIANGHLRRLRSESGLPLDEWARCCISDAVAAFPAEVGWPCDMVVGRAESAGGRKIIERRIGPHSATGLADFFV